MHLQPSPKWKSKQTNPKPGRLKQCPNEYIKQTKSTDFFLCWPTAPGHEVRPALKCGSCTPWNSIGENLFFLWKWLVTANNFSVRGGIHVWLDSVLLQSLWVHTCIRSCCVWNTLLPRCSPPSLALTGFLPPLLHIFLCLKGKGLIKTPCLDPSAPQSLIVCAVYSCRLCYYAASPSSGPQRCCQEVYNPCHWIQPSLRLKSSYSMWKPGTTF